jgi:AAA+ ATPase superfamily predicted ATPase
MNKIFVGRKRELALLDKLSTKKDAQFLVVYGRRRVGKSRLLIHWAQQRQKPFLYWVATETTSTQILAHFSQAFYAFSRPDSPPPAHDFSYHSWEQALKEVAAYAKTRALVLILDEFTYALKSAPELASLLQNTWDLLLKESQIFLIISGSQVHMMMKAVHSYQAPLYGRATARLHLNPLRYQGVAEFFPAYGPEELIAVQAVLGGIPAYLEKLDPGQSFSDNLRAEILQPNTLMQSDAALLLHEQFEEPATYAAILAAIAGGKRSPKEIALAAGVDQTHVSRYLATLTELGLAERLLPVTDWQKAASRKGRYEISDPYLRFYFRFVAPSLARLELGETAALLNDLKLHLRGFIGQYVFEAFCRDWAGLLSDRKKLPLLLNQIGSYWGSDAQIDVMGLMTSEKKVLIGECKWGLEKVGPEVIEKLTRQAPKAINHLAEPAKWQPYLYLFTRTPLTEEAADLAVQHQVTVVTLEQLDADLRTEE